MKAYLLIAALCVSGALAWEPERHDVPEIKTLVPECTKRELDWLWPNFNDATRFYQCGGINWRFDMPCAAGTWFSFEHQICVHPYQWVSPQPPTLPTPEPTPGPTPEVTPPPRPPRPSGKPPGKPWWPHPPRPTPTDAPEGPPTASPTLPTAGPTDPSAPPTPGPTLPTAPPTEPAPLPTPGPTLPTAPPTEPPCTCP